LYLSIQILYQQFSNQGEKADMSTSIRLTPQKPEVIAVSQKDATAYGCPYCGYDSGFIYLQNSQAYDMVCGECHQLYIVLADGEIQSTIGINGTFPTLQPHPRHGIPSHSRPDKRPEGGGEFLSSRGIGLDSTPGCFVCGGKQGMYNNIAAFVITKAAGERVVAMFHQGARLDYREHEPDWIQVKIGACNRHLPNLQILDGLIDLQGGVITAEMVRLTSKT
jgi:hypothetical protein